MKIAINNCCFWTSFRFFLISIFFLLIFISVPEISIAASYIDNLATRVIGQELHTNRAWLGLLHYRKTTFSGGYLSQADKPGFYLSPEGRTNPQRELLATLEAMFLPKELGDEHAQCRFPARFSWLTKQLEIDLTRLPLPDCDSLNRWQKDLDADQVTLVFPAAYMNSPSSMFGHSFLRLESADRTKHQPLMDPTVSFAADTLAQEGLLDYITRGLFGGFPSKCTVQPYYERLKRYSDTESRDIWEYRLNLTEKEVKQLVLHVWETKDGVFDYYFIGENCAYRLIALLDVARPALGLSDGFTRATLPVDTIRALKDRGAVISTLYQGSAVKKVEHRASLLSDAEAELVANLGRGSLSVGDVSLYDLSRKRRSIVLGVAYEYLSLLINKDILDRELSTKLSREIIAERIKSCDPIKSFEITRPKTSPDEGHRTHRFSAGGGIGHDNNFVFLGYRDIGHSLMDPFSGFEKGAQIELLDIEFRVHKEGDVSFERMELMNVTSLTPISRFLKPVSWRFALGLEKRHLHDEQGLIGYMEAGSGITVSVGKVMVSGLLHIEFDSGSVLDDGFGLGAGMYFDAVFQDDKYSWTAGITSMKYLAGDSDSITRLRVGGSVPLGSENAFFAKGITVPERNQNSYEIQFGVHHYF